MPGDRRLTLLYWTPRTLAIVFICFIALFALDVFVPGKTIGYYLVTLFMHLIPNFILAGILIVAWRHERIGGLLFILLAVIFTLFFRSYTMPMSFLLVSVPVFLIGGLFLLHNYLVKERSKYNVKTTEN